MKRFLLDAGIVGDFINRRRGIYERARHEVAQGNRVGIGIPVLAELAYGLEQLLLRGSTTLPHGARRAASRPWLSARMRSASTSTATHPKRGRTS
jgi:hypothetical protein